jgi:[acyl-carrier-protein] S-malonyltransferase
MTDKTAILFPGQGAQFIGMGSGLIASSDRAQSLFAQASELLDLDLTQVLLEGPEDLLNSTRMSQPAIFVLSMAVLDELGQRLGGEARFGQDLVAAATAGLSLGEYSALVFAGSMTFEDALRVVVARGQFMQEACDEEPGGMTSIMGLEAGQVEEAVESCSGAGRIGVSNYNSPVQTVISGDQSAVDEAAEMAQKMGARRAIPLKVTGAYHSPLMATATKKLIPILEGVSMAAPRCPFYSNFTGGRVEEPEEIRQGLIRQVESSVRWVEIVRAVVDGGAGDGIEIGPGRVVAGLVKNIDRTLKVRSICEPETIDELMTSAG